VCKFSVLKVKVQGHRKSNISRTVTSQTDATVSCMFTSYAVTDGQTDNLL